MDLVSQTTKRALEASLKKLLLQKPLNKITINDITEDCGVNRMTFYYHFKDIYDLVDWIMVEDAAKALEGRQSFENWTDAFLDILHQVQDNKVLVMNVLTGTGTNRSIGTTHSSAKHDQNRILSVIVRVVLLQYHSMKPANAMM